MQTKDTALCLFIFVQAAAFAPNLASDAQRTDDKCFEDKSVQYVAAGYGAKAASSRHLMQISKFTANNTKHANDQGLSLADGIRKRRHEKASATTRAREKNTRIKHFGWNILSAACFVSCILMLALIMWCFLAPRDTGVQYGPGQTSGRASWFPPPSEPVRENPSQPLLAYRPEIDGLRCLAVIPVVLFHFKVGAVHGSARTRCWIPGGYVGVDIFFVISGYLITRILVSDLSSGKPLTGFWIRRIRRLFPAVAAVLVFVVFAGNFVFLPDAYSDVLRQVLAVLFVVMNFLMYQTNSYFGTQVETPLLHCWSLAIEEQFYVIYPLALYLLWKFGLKSQGTLALQVLIIVCSLPIAVIATPHDAQFAYYLMPSRAWELALGGMLVFQPKSMTQALHKHIADGAAWIGVTMMVIPMITYSAATPYPSYRALMPCVGSAFVIAFTAYGDTTCGRALSWKPLIFVGKISYSLYLWHWVFYIFLVYSSGHTYLTTRLTILGVLASFGVATMSYYFIETVFRSKDWVGDASFLRLSFGVWLALVLISGACFSLGLGGVHLQDAAPIHGTIHITPTTKSALDSTGNVSTGLKLNCSTAQLILTNSNGNGTCLLKWSAEEMESFYSVDSSLVSAASVAEIRETPWSRYDSKADRKAKIFGKSPTPEIAVVGNSHCLMYGPTLEKVAISAGMTIGFLCANAETSLFGDYGSYGRAPKTWDDYRKSVLAAWRPKKIMYVAYWAAILQYAPNRLLEPTIRTLAELTEQLIILGSPAILPRWLADLDGGGTLLYKFASTKCAYEGCKWLESVAEDSELRAYRLKEENLIRSYITKPGLPGRARFVPVDHLFISNTTGHIKILDPCTRGLAYRDENHLNLAGAARVSQIFQTELFDGVTCNQN